MFVAGMLMGEQNLLAVLRIRSIWKVAFLRLIALPLVVLCIFKYSGLAALVPDGQSILMISLLAASALRRLTSLRSLKSTVMKETTPAPLM